MRTPKKLIISLLTGTGITAITTYIGTISIYAKSNIASGSKELYYDASLTPMTKVIFFLLTTLITFIALLAVEKIREASKKQKNIDKAQNADSISPLTIHKAIKV